MTSSISAADVRQALASVHAVVCINSGLPSAQRLAG